MKIIKGNLFKLALAGAPICVALDLLAQDVPGRWYLGLDTGAAPQQDITLENNNRARFGAVRSGRHIVAFVPGGIHFQVLKPSKL